MKCEQGAGANPMFVAFEPPSLAIPPLIIYGRSLRLNSWYPSPAHRLPNSTG